MKNRATIINIVACVLMIVTVALQFLPFWTYEDGTASIAGYIWLPDSYKALTKTFQAIIHEDFTINNIHAPFALQMLLTLVGIVLCVLNRKKTWPAVVGGISGLFGIYGFLTKPVMQMGSTWIIQLAVCVVLLLVAIVALIPSKRKPAAA